MPILQLVPVAVNGSAQSRWDCELVVAKVLRGQDPMPMVHPVGPIPHRLVVPLAIAEELTVVQLTPRKTMPNANIGCLTAARIRACAGPVRARLPAFRGSNASRTGCFSAVCR